MNVKLVQQSDRLRPQITSFTYRGDDVTCWPQIIFVPFFDLAGVVTLHKVLGSLQIVDQIYRCQCNLHPWEFLSHRHCIHANQMRLALLLLLDVIVV